MPTNRKRVARGLKPVLHDSLRLYLETGDLRKALKTYPLCPDKANMFRLANPTEAVRKRLKVVWLQHQAEILGDWRKSKKRGLPWAEKEFSKT